MVHYFFLISQDLTATPKSLHNITNHNDNNNNSMNVKMKLSKSQIYHFNELGKQL